LPIKSLIVASSWSHLYLLIKDERSFEHKVSYYLFLLQSRLHMHSEYVSMPYNTEFVKALKVAKVVP